MERMVNLIILSVLMGIGGYLPVIFGAGVISAWSFAGSIAGGIAAIVVIYKLNV